MFARNPISGSHPQGNLRVRQGRDLWFGEAPDATKIAPCPVGSVGLMGADYSDLCFDPIIAEGDAVVLGQTLCTDRHQPSITLVAPCAGRVESITRGARRRLKTLVITPEGSDTATFDVPSDPSDSAALRDVLLKSGAWVSFRTRPFGRVPHAEATPAAIFITATDTRPLAADPRAVLSDLSEQFQRGVTAIHDLTQGPIFLCQPEGPALVPAMDRLRIVQVSGPHPAGLAGTQTHHLFPVSEIRTVWEINAQDVAAIGHLLMTGTVMGTRVVSVAGTGVTQPQLLRAPLGAAISDLTRGRLAAPGVRALTGSPLDGRDLPYLARRDVQVSAVLPTPSRAGVFGWFERVTATKDGATLPMEAFERSFPFDLLPAPLMRALASGDVESAQRLGCLELLEEDMALLTEICPSGCDYGVLLRQTLDVLAEDLSA